MTTNTAGNSATNSTTAEDRLAALGIQLPDAPQPFGAYVPAVQTGNLLFLSGMLATAGHTVTIAGILGKDLDAHAGRAAAHGRAQWAGGRQAAARLAKPREPRGAARRVYGRDAGVRRSRAGRRRSVGIVSRCVWRGDDFCAVGTRRGEHPPRLAGRTRNHFGSAGLMTGFLRKDEEFTTQSRGRRRRGGAKGSSDEAALRCRFVSCRSVPIVNICG